METSATSVTELVETMTYCWCFDSASGRMVCFDDFSLDDGIGSKQILLTGRV